MSSPDQLDQLASMGMAIPDHDWADHCLRHIGYHRLSGYWRPFEVQGTPVDGRLTLEGTSFDDILTLYNFDGQLRSTLAHALGHIEISVRAIWADHMAIAGGNQAHLKPELFTAARYRQHLDDLKQTYQRTVEWQNSIWDVATIWEVAESMSFGQISKWYNAVLLRRTRNTIAAHYQANHLVMSSILFNLAHLRNICAHHARLWNRNLYTGLRIPRALEPYCNPATRDRLYNRLVIVAFLMGIVDPRSSWKSRLVDLVQAHTAVSKERMGFPLNWCQMPFWQT